MMIITQLGHTGCVLVAFASLLAGTINTATIALASPAITLNPANTVNGGYSAAQTTNGWEFIPVAPMTITHLGLFDQWDDGLRQSHPIGVWSSDGTLIVSTVLSVGTAHSLINHFRYEPVQPTSLTVGQSYTIGFYSESQDYESFDAEILKLTTFSVHPDINYIRGVWAFADPAGLHMPTHSGDSGSDPDRFGPNFQFVPEPATLGLLVIGAGLLLGHHPRHRVWAHASHWRNRDCEDYQ